MSSYDDDGSGKKQLQDGAELKQRLTDMEYAVTQLKGTEP